MAEITAEVGAKRKRIPEISFLNILLCVLVVFIHSSSEPVSSLDKSTLSWAICFIPWRLSAFAVQGFLLLSGVKLFLGAKQVPNILPCFYRKAFSHGVSSICVVGSRLLHILFASPVF